MVAENTTGMTVHQMPTSALAKTDPTRAFEPRDIDEGFRLASMLVQSGLLPRGIQRPEAAFAIIAAGRELGLTAMQSLRSIHIIEGKPTLSADLVAALCKSRPEICKYFRLVESTDKVARYETLRIGEPAVTAMSFTWEDAVRAQVTGKDNWKKYPAAMLRARCITALARAVYPDLAMGVYDPDEVIADAAPSSHVHYEAVAVSETVAPVADAKAFAALCERVDVAENAASLNAIAKDAVKAAKSGAITDGNMEALKGAVTRKRGMLGTPAPKSKPRVDDVSAEDAYDASEAGYEAEATAVDS